MNTHLDALLAEQRRAFDVDRFPPATVRKERIDRCIELLIAHQDDIVDALAEDYGQRPAEQTLMSEVYGSIMVLKHNRRNLGRWMRPERRRVQFPLGLLGARARVHFQPKGVVGLVSPWNFPVNLTFAPLASVLAAGNRAIVKPSEVTAVTAALIQELVSRYFDATELAVVTGGPDVGAAFSALPLDHLLYTGSTAVGRKVAQAAAENLVPTTLELGGKSPVVIGADADLRMAALRTMTGKLLNAGQICLAPDYVLCPEPLAARFVEQLTAASREMYTHVVRNPDYASIVNDHHIERIRRLVDDARERGAQVVTPVGSPDAPIRDRLLPPMILTNVTAEMAVMQEEIFGPVLPVITYATFADALAFVNARAKPLALYYFGGSSPEKRALLRETASGGLCINDVVMHASVADLPFGGIGPSGTGRYHGKDGFREFSNVRAVYRQGLIDMGAFARAPYTAKTRRFIRRLIGEPRPEPRGARGKGPG